MKALLMVMVLAGVAHADDASAVLAKAQKFYAGADHLKAVFEQQVANATFYAPDLKSPIEQTLFVIDTHQPGYTVGP